MEQCVRHYYQNTDQWNVFFFVFFWKMVFSPPMKQFWSLNASLRLFFFIFTSAYFYMCLKWCCLSSNKPFNNFQRKDPVNVLESRDYILHSHCVALFKVHSCAGKQCMGVCTEKCGESKEVFIILKVLARKVYKPYEASLELESCLPIPN